MSSGSHFHNFILACKPLTLVLLSLTFANINGFLTCVGLSISIFYGIRKWIFLERQNKQINKQNEKSDIDFN